MWKLKKSRGQFEARASEYPPVSAIGLEPILGSAGGERGNFTLLDELMGAVHAANGRGRHSERVFCGVVGGTFTGASEANHNGAWISIGERFVRLVHSVSAVAIGFRDLVPEAEFIDQRDGDGAGLNMLRELRNSGMNYISKSVGVPFQGNSDDVLWDRFKAAECTLLTQGAILWVLSHEMAHLMQGDSSRYHFDKAMRTKRFSEASRLPADYWPRPLRHREEVAADWAGLAIARHAMHPTALYSVLMPASIVATTALTVDGWHADGSAVSGTHPSPSLRAAIIEFFWAHHLHDAYVRGWDDGLPPSEATITKFAQAHVFTRWIDGLYREGREGFTTSDDILATTETLADVVSGRAALDLPSLA